MEQTEKRWSIVRFWQGGGGEATGQYFPYSVDSLVDPTVK